MQIDKPTIEKQSGALIISHNGIKIILPEELNSDIDISKNNNDCITSDEYIAITNKFKEDMNEISEIHFLDTQDTLGIITLIRYILYAIENENWKSEYLNSVLVDAPSKRASSHLRIVE